MQVSQARLMRLILAVALYAVLQHWQCCNAQNSTVASGQAGQQVLAEETQVEEKLMGYPPGVVALTKGVRFLFSVFSLIAL